MIATPAMKAIGANIDTRVMAKLLALRAYTTTSYAGLTIFAFDTATTAMIVVRIGIDTSSEADERRTFGAGRQAGSTRAILATRTSMFAFSAVIGIFQRIDTTLPTVNFPRRTCTFSFDADLRCLALMAAFSTMKSIRLKIDTASTTAR